MKLIIGLGNPGNRHKLTRHNLGFEILDRFASRLKISIWHRKHTALTGFGRLANVELILAKPLTYMNSSGESAKGLVAAYQVDIQDLIVVYDDINLGLEKLRIRKRGSDGGHKGMRSIIEQLNSEELIRIRVGIGLPPDGVDSMDYVLSPFSDEEREVVEKVKDRAVEALETLVLDGIEAAMSRYN